MPNEWWHKMSTDQKAIVIAKRVASNKKRLKAKGNGMDIPLDVIPDRITKRPSKKTTKRTKPKVIGPIDFHQRALQVTRAMVVLDLPDLQLSLTPDEARSAYNQLHELFGG